MRDDVLENIEQQGEAVIGIGHSFGGVLTLLAAAKKPELFQSIILLDPPLFSVQKSALIKLLRALNIEDWVSPSGKSKKRRDHFESKSQAKTLFQANKLFKNFHPQTLNDYVTHGLTETDNALFQANKLFKNFHPQTLNDYVTHGLTEKANDVELTIPVAKEVAIFHKSLTSFPKNIYKVKGTLVYAAKNPILWPSDLRWINRKFAHFQVIPFPGSHLFPLENPESTSLMIKRCL